MNPPSRRRVAKFIADQLANGEPSQHVAKVLAAYLVMNRQTRMGELLLRDIEAALLKYHKHLVADVISARGLSHEVDAVVVEMLKHETGAKTAEILSKVDPSLVGGVIVRTPDSEMDASLKTKLMKLRAI